MALGTLFVGVIYDLITNRLLLDQPYIAPYTFIAFILMQSAILSGRTARAHRKAEHLTENLKREVESQTRDLQLKTLESQEATLEALMAKEEAELLRAAAERQSEQLKELDHQKTAFFQNMSHELRTPLTLILNPLEDEASEQPENRNLEIAAKNSRRLLRLVNQLLDFHKHLLQDEQDHIPHKIFLWILKAIY